MTEIETWTKFIDSAKHAITVQVVQNQVTLDINTFRILMGQGGWHPEDRIIIKENNPRNPQNHDVNPELPVTMQSGDTVTFTRTVDIPLDTP